MQIGAIGRKAFLFPPEDEVEHHCYLAFYITHTSSTFVTLHHSQSEVGGKLVPGCALRGFQGLVARPRHLSPADRAGDHGHDEGDDGDDHGHDDGDDGDDHGHDDNHALSLLLPWINGPFCILHQLSTGS